VNRISPEAPVPVVNVIKRESRLGGAGNVVLNIASLGAKPYVCSVIGDDSTGETLQGILEAVGLSTAGIITEKGRPTTVKERVIAGSQQLIRVDSETEAPISATSSKALLEQVKTWLPEVDVILFEDYDKGVLSADLIQEIILLAKAKQIPTVVDPKKKNFFAYSGATLFKPNLNELRDGLGLEPDAVKPEAIAKTVAEFKAVQSFTGLFVTMSERGVYMDYATDQIQSLRTFAKSPMFQAPVIRSFPSLLAH
jgi:rfaE bifunctional protein kinase chain/domain